jgi:hypothetical protein
MNERDSLLEILRLLAAAGCIDGKVFVQGEDGRSLEVHAHVPPARAGDRRSRPRHLRSVA